MMQLLKYEINVEYCWASVSKQSSIEVVITSAIPKKKKKINAAIALSYAATYPPWATPTKYGWVLHSRDNYV